MPSLATFSHAEREAIVLASVVRIIDDMVNRALFDFPGSDGYRQPFPKTALSKKYFALRLTDFLSETDQHVGIPKRPYLRHLREIVAAPSFGEAGRLAASVERFALWLEETVHFSKVWLPTLNIETSLTPTRISWMKVTGDLQKHDALRSMGVAQAISKWLEQAGHDTDTITVLGALDDFREWLTDDPFSAYLVPCAYHLNEIRWGVHLYWQPYLSKAVHWLPTLHEDIGIPAFEADPQVSHPFAELQRRSLLMWCAKSPIMPSFKIRDSWHGLDEVFSSR